MLKRNVKFVLDLRRDHRWTERFCRRERNCYDWFCLIRILDGSGGDEVSGIGIKRGRTFNRKFQSRSDRSIIVTSERTVSMNWKLCHNEVR